MKIFIALSAEIVKPDISIIRQIRKDPEAYAYSAPIRELVSVIRAANQYYHDKAQPFITDDQYDVIKDVLKERSPNNKVLTEVGAEPSGRMKVELPYPMYSLSKIKGDDLEAVQKWVKAHPGPYVISDKLDGASLQIIYKNGLLANIYTRGKNNIGQDVTRLGSSLKIPKKIPSKVETAVRAEAIMSPENFRQYEGEFANPRNFVAGLINKIKSNSDALRHVDVISHELITPRTTPEQAFKQLQAWKFNVVPHKVVKDVDQGTLLAFLKTRKKASGHEMDGLVVEQNKKTKRPPAGTHSPDYAVAFKVNAAEDTVQTKVIEVVWEESKHSLLKPRVNIQPVKLKGITIKYASGHNAKYIEENKIGPGAIIQITRSGDVIPFIVSVVTPARKGQLPDESYTWSKNHVDIILDESTDLALAKQITFFFKSIGVENLALKTVQLLVEEGYDTPLKIVRATEDDFLDLPRFAERKAQKLYKEIQSKLTNIDILTLMEATGIFGRGMGAKKLAPILKTYPRILQYADQPKLKLVKMALAVPGYSDITAEQFAVGLPKFNKWYKSSGLKATLPKAIKVTGKALLGQSVLFTGFRNAELEQAIKQQGGEVASSITKATILLAKDPNGSSSKLDKARSKGIPIMTEDKFRAKYKL